MKWAWVCSGLGGAALGLLCALALGPWSLIAAIPLASALGFAIGVIYR